MYSGVSVRALALATAGIFAAAGCGGSNGPVGQNPAPPDKQVLRVNVDTEPATLDPTQQSWAYEGAVGRNVFEALTRPKADLSDVEGAAASSWTVSGDGLTWTFKIRSGEKFSDGTPVTASDFVYGYKRLLDPTVAAAYEYNFEMIAGASGYAGVDAKSASAVRSFLNGLGLSAPDPQTFVIKLDHPAPYFKWVTSLWVAVPLKKADVDAAGADFGAVTAESAAKIHGNGPFVISELVPKDHITLSPSKQYRTQAILQKVILYYISDANVEFAKFQNGELDMTRGVPNPDVPTVLNDPKLSKQLLRGPTLLNYWINFNTTRAPLNNGDLRLALAKSLDRESYIKNVRKGVGTSATYFIPNGERGYEQSDTQKYDCNQAKQLLAKAKTAGVTDTQLAGLHYMYPASSARKASSEFFQQQWKQCLGLNIIVDAVEGQTYANKLKTSVHDFWIAGVSGWQADYPDGQNWMDLFVTGSGNNYAAWSNKQYDQLVQKADNAAKQTDRDIAYSQAQKLLEQEAPVMFLFQDEKFLLIASKVRGYHRSAIDDDWIGDVATATTMYIAA